MYIKLGNIKSHYNSGSYNDFMIISQVVDSQMGYHKPVLVRTTEELDIWFGKEFKDRDFLVHLLELGVTLYLNKPESTEIYNNTEDYIDLSTYITIDNIYMLPDWVDINSVIKVEDLGTRRGKIFKIVDQSSISDGENIPTLEAIFLGESDNEEEDELIYIKDLPQNINSGSKSISKLNRDTLAIFDNGDYCSPRYTEDIFGDDIFDISSINEDIDNITINKNSLDYNKLGNQQYTFAFDIDIDVTTMSNRLNRLGDNEYYFLRLTYDREFDITSNGELTTTSTTLEPIIRSSESRSYLEDSIIRSSACIYFKPDSSLPEEYKYMTSGLSDSGIYYVIKENSHSSYLINTSLKDKFLVDKNKFLWIDKINTSSRVKSTIVTGNAAVVNYFYNIPGFSMEPNFRITNDIIYKTRGNLTFNPITVKYEISEKPVVSFVSKTIGCVEDIDGKIKINIEKQVGSYYNIKISRFDYEEEFVGSIKSSINEERLDNVITKNSKLVDCYFNIIPKEDKDGVEIIEIPEGTWYLRGAEKEDYTAESYLKSFNTLVNSGQDSIYIDQFLIPDIKSYIREKRNGEDYYKIFEDFYSTVLDSAKQYNFQVLIQNNLFWKGIEKIKTDDIATLVPSNLKPNYLYVVEEDTGSKKTTYYKANVNNSIVSVPEYNRVLGDFMYNYIGDEENRLIYFLNSMTVGDIEMPGYYIYLTDLLLNDKYTPSLSNILYETPGKEPYETEDIEKILEEKKCNYLIDNNHIYYYEKYQNGDNFTTSGWMRFCLGKVSRELIKHKWDIIDDQRISSIESRLYSLLNGITNSFSMIRGIYLTNYSISAKDKTLDLTIDTYMSDLVDNNIRIDITLNFNKK